MPSDLSLYYFAGDFADVIARYRSGTPQSYGTHDEVARLLDELTSDGVRVRVVSFVTPAPRSCHPLPGLEVVDLGAADFSVTGLLRTAVEQDDSRMIVAGFPHPELLRAVLAAPARRFAVLASSYNETTWRARVRRRLLVRRLNDPRFEWVSNHGLPSTAQLAGLGVHRHKLIPWDIPHDLDAVRLPAKRLGDRTDGTVHLVYVGSIMEAKGVPDLIDAVAALRHRFDVRVDLLGDGDIESMSVRAARAGVADRVAFLGRVDNPTAREHMAAATAVVVPSRHEYPEGFPLTLYEALASRTPVVASDHPMFTTHMVDGESAVTFRAGDVAALTGAITRLVGDARLYDRLSEIAPATLDALTGSADYRTMITRWYHDEHPSPWLAQQSIASSCV